MIAAIFLSFVAGIAVTLLYAVWLSTKPTKPKPKAERHPFSATSTGPDTEVAYFHRAIEQLERHNG